MSDPYDFAFSGRTDAQFTVRLRDIVESPLYGDEWMYDFPIFRDDYKPILVKLIKDEYWFEEIGHESEELFIHRYKTVMQRNMPTLNRLYRMYDQELDAFSNYKMTTEGKSKSDGSAESEAVRSDTADSSSSTQARTETDSRATNYEMPQTQLDQNGNYASNASSSLGGVTANTDVESTAENIVNDQGKSVSTTMDEYLTNVHGITGMTDYQAVAEAARNLLNVDEMVIETLRPLFFGLSGNSFSLL